MIIDIAKFEKQREQWWQNDPYWRNNPDNQVGYFPNRPDITILPADNPRKLRLGWKIYETVGIVIINDCAISRIDIGEKPTTENRPRELGSIYIFPEFFLTHHPKHSII